jgi:hypothetical protein
MYGPKAAGAWPAGVSLQGPQGVAGTSSAFYDIGINVVGTPAASEVLEYYAVPRAFTIPAGATASQAIAQTAATASTVFTIYRIPSGGSKTSIGTITFAAAGKVGTFSVASAVSFAAGDILELDAPATADSTLANIAFTLAATRP